MRRKTFRLNFWILSVTTLGFLVQPVTASAAIPHSASPNVVAAHTQVRAMRDLHLHRFRQRTLGFVPLHIRFVKIPLLLDAPEAVQEWATPIINQNEPNVSTFDFDNRTYALVTYGAKPSVGYGIGISRVVSFRNNLGVMVKCYNPSAGQVASPHTDHPFSLVSFDKQNKPVYFYITYVYLANQPELAGGDAASTRPS